MTAKHFDDRTPIVGPFGLLDGDTQARLFHAMHNAGILFYGPDGWALREGKAPLSNVMVYRAKPAPPTQDIVPWDALPDWVVWVGRDRSGAAWAYSYEPKKGSNCFLQSSGHETLRSARVDDSHKGYIPGTCDWRDSLQRRPEA